MKKTNNINIQIIKKIFETVNLGTVAEIKRNESSQNIVYEVTTNEKKYILKEYTKDAIKNTYDLQNRKRQLSVAEKMSANGVPSILPLGFNNKYFIHYKNTYYLIYDFLEYNILTEETITIKNIKKLANTQAIIHKLNIQCNLPCHYRKININYDKYLKKFKNKPYALALYNILNKNLDLLKELTTNANDNIKYAKEHMCIGHNDYKLKNILWKKDFMYLIDFDACGPTNPTANLAESSFALSKQGKEINLDYYKEYLKTYIKKYGPLETDYEIALNVCMNGKLQWLEYLFSKCSKRNIKEVEATISMIKELLLFTKNKENFYNIYTEIAKNKKK